MANQKVIKVRLSINLSADDFGFARVFNELSAIEDTGELLNTAKILSLKRSHLLGILYQYSSESPVMKSAPRHDQAPTRVAPSMGVSVDIDQQPLGTISNSLSEREVEDIFRSSMGDQGIGLE